MVAVSYTILNLMVSLLVKSSLVEMHFERTFDDVDGINLREHDWLKAIARLVALFCLHDCNSLYVCIRRTHGVVVCVYIHVYILTH